MKKIEKPKHFIFLKILGFLGVTIAVVGVFLLITGFSDFESNNFLIGMFLLPIGLVLGIFGLTTGFSPEIAKMSAKSIQYIQTENEETLTDIATTSAEITSEAVSTVAQAIKKGLGESKFCKHCGAKIDADSKYCSNCGGAQ